MDKGYVLDACAVIALLKDEDGAQLVEKLLADAEKNEAFVCMNAVNLLEIYYDFYRTYGESKANERLMQIKSSAIRVIHDFTTDLLKEAGRLKATYKISLADSIVLAQAVLSDGSLVTADHHEFDAVESAEPIKFLWIR